MFFVNVVVAQGCAADRTRKVTLQSRKHEATMVVPPGRLVAALLLLLPTAFGLHFYVDQSTPRCFLEEVPPETLIVGEYKNPDFVVFGSPGFTGVVS